MVPRVKQQFWPSVPDPANSSLGKWVPAELQQVRPGQLLPCALLPTGHCLRGIGGQWRGCSLRTGSDHALPAPQEPLQVPGVKEPGPSIISTVTVLERAVGKPPCAGEPSVPCTVPQEGRGSPSRGWSAAGPCPGPAGSGEPVQYARVMGSGYKEQQHRLPRLYLRSSSTQPLLLDPSPSPLPYENLWLGCPGDGGCPEELPATFPLLQGLRIGGAEELPDCRAA